MDPPSLPPVTAGRSALPAFLPLETWARKRTAAARQAAEDRLVSAQAEGERIRSEGEAALRDAVLTGEREALREVDDRARDRTSEARRAVNAWIEAAEQDVAALLDDAVDRICGG